MSDRMLLEALSVLVIGHLRASRGSHRLKAWLGTTAAVICVTFGGHAHAAAQSLDLSRATIEDLNRAFEEGALTSRRLIETYLLRIEAYDRHGPELNAILWLNDRALETASALDAERRERGPRSPLHGIPVVLKDNVDTGDMPTTAGSILLAGSIPPDDAFIVKKLREASAIILAKVNMSEFASGGTRSSVGDFYMKNPHALERTPSGSSGGTGISIAASFAQLGIGTDTGGSVRGPSTSNGIVGMRPTHGLLSRDGIVPLSSTLDMPGPMTRHVYDLAAMLSVMTGVDSADPATTKSEGRFDTDYTRFLDPGALEGARIGIARDFMGYDEEVDWVTEAALESMRAAGATVIEVRYPGWLLDVKGDWYTTVRWPEFRAEIAQYLATLRPEYPKTLSEMIKRSRLITSPTPEGGRPNPTRWTLFQQEEASGTKTDYEYLAMRDHGFPLVRDLVAGMIESMDLDAIVYPTSPTRPALLEGGGGGGAVSATNIASIAGFPDLVVPAGFTSNRLPVGISFMGPAFSEGRLIALGYAFEQATHARRDPVHAPPLSGDKLRR